MKPENCLRRSKGNPTYRLMQLAHNLISGRSSKAMGWWQAIQVPKSGLSSFVGHWSTE